MSGGGAADRERRSTVIRPRIFSRAEIEDGAASGYDAVISVRGTRRASFRTLDQAIAEAVLGEVDAILVLRFDDVGVPAFGRQAGPTDDDAARVLEFARGLRARPLAAKVAIHCEAGRSRSAAIALGVLADELGPGAEADAVSMLLGLDVEGKVCPNPLLVRLLDSRLWRYGALENALAGACPAYVAARSNWAGVAADPRGAVAARVERRRRQRRNEYDQEVSGEGP